MARISTSDTLSLLQGGGGVQVGGVEAPLLSPTVAIWVTM